MSGRKMRRYQLRKEAIGVVHRHPWIFREQLSSAASVFADGDWLRLYDGANQIVGHGVYEAEGAIAIRVVRSGAAPADARYFRGRVAAAIGKRAELATHGDGLRLVHGESDAVPGVVVDRFGDVIVATSYSAGMDGVARYVAMLLQHPEAMVEPDVAVVPKPAKPAKAAKLPRLAKPELPAAAPSPAAVPSMSKAASALAKIIGPATHVVIRPAHRRHAETAPARVLRGAPPAVAHFTEDGIRYAVDLEAGHKTGAYLDLRALRRALAAAPLTGARVLNLFSYTGMLGRAAEAAGAADITHVDQSERALAFAAAQHVVDPARHHFITADVFDWLPKLDPADTYDLVIVDPPAMTSRKAQVPTVLAAYHKLYRAAAAHVRPGGTLIAACCTSRVTRDAFARTVRAALGPEFGHARDLPPEPDHPVAFPQADYLKVALWKRIA